jgi:hypothetical protein
LVINPFFSSSSSYYYWSVALAFIALVLLS